MTDAVRQWKRRAQVIVGKGGTGLLIEDLRIYFKIIKTVESTPNSAEIKIYNLSPAKEVQIKKEFDEIIVNAGYLGNTRLTFRGNIQHVYRFKEGPDHIVQIIAGDGDQDFRGAIMNETLAAGTTSAQLVSRAVQSFMGGTSLGHVVTKTKPLPRGKVVSGNTRDVLHKVARESGANWSIQDGQLVIVPTKDVLPTEAIDLSYETGLLGAPEVNDKGVAATCLLNPELRVNGKIKLNNDEIKAKIVATPPLASATQKASAKTGAPVKLNADGIYKVLKLTHTGDTRGKDWTSEVECIGLGQPIPAARSQTIGGA